MLMFAMLLTSISASFASECRKSCSMELKECKAEAKQSVDLGGYGLYELNDEKQLKEVRKANKQICIDESKVCVESCKVAEAYDKSGMGEFNSFFGF